MDFIAVIIGSLFATAFFSGLAIIVYLAVADIFGRAVRFAEVAGFKSGPHNSASWSSYKFRRRRSLRNLLKVDPRSVLWSQKLRSTVRRLCVRRRGFTRRLTLISERIGPRYYVWKITLKLLPRLNF